MQMPTSPAARTHGPAALTVFPRAGVPASPQDRAIAFVVDLAIFVAAAPFTLGLAALVLRPFWPIGALAGAVLYCFVAYRAGQSPGMHLARIAVVNSNQRRTVSASHALLRAVLVVAPPAVALALVSIQVPGPGQTGPTASFPELWAGAAILAFGVFDHLWMLGDSAHRALHDILTRVVVVSVR